MTLNHPFSILVFYEVLLFSNSIAVNYNLSLSFSLFLSLSHSLSLSVFLSLCLCLSLTFSSFTLSFSLSHTLSLSLSHTHTHTHHSSINRPPIMRLYRLPSASILRTTQLKKCVCVLLSVVFDSLVTDSNLLTMIEYLPPPVIEVNNVTSHIIFWFLFKYIFSN